MKIIKFVNFTVLLINDIRLTIRIKYFMAYWKRFIKLLFIRKDEIK